MARVPKADLKGLRWQFQLEVRAREALESVIGGDRELPLHVKFTRALREKIGTAPICSKVYSFDRVSLSSSDSSLTWLETQPVSAARNAFRLVECSYTYVTGTRFSDLPFLPDGYTRRKFTTTAHGGGKEALSHDQAILAIKSYEAEKTTGLGSGYGVMGCGSNTHETVAHPLARFQLAT